MSVFNKLYKPSKTTNFMRKLNNILYLSGLRHFWIEPVTFSHEFTKRYDVVSKALYCTDFVYMLVLFPAILTQKNLTTKQQSDVIIELANPLSQIYCYIFLYHRTSVREILNTLMIVLKEVHNDPAVEEQMIRKLKLYLTAFFVSSICMLTFYGLFGVYQKICLGMAFITLIPGWPDVWDMSTEAEIARVVIYGYWWVYYVRISGFYVILLCMLISLSKQYKNLQSYFSSLDKIFSENLSQAKKEEKYEEGFIKGVQMHSKTIWCLNQTKIVCGTIFNAQMLLAVGAFVSLLRNLMNPHHGLATVPTMVLELIAMGYFMCNAGDISVEASFLPRAIYGSGWQNCCLRSIRIRKLVVITMTQAQEPVALLAFGAIELSYNCYLGIIRTAYSVCSVFY